VHKYYLFVATALMSAVAALAYIRKNKAINLKIKEKIYVKINKNGGCFFSSVRDLRFVLCANQRS
jgi:hypothetical protein